MNEEYPDLPFVPPKSYSLGRPNGSPRLIVVHYTAGSEGPTSAEDGASYDQRRTDGTSAHYYIDQNSIVQCVYTGNRAHTALWNGNQVGIHYELCGTVQNRSQWLDAASLATIRRAATQIRRDMAKYNVPAVKLTAQQVRDGYRGICGHAEVTAAWPEDGGDHTDPGVEFPWDVLISAIQEGDDVAIPGAYDDYLPDTVMAVLTGETPRFGYVAATGPSWDNDAVTRYNLKAVEGRILTAIRAVEVKTQPAPEINYRELAAALLNEMSARSNAS